MAEWITGLEGTEAGKTLAMALALFAAVVHAFFGAIQKGPRLDPWESRAAIDIFYGLLALPLVLFVVPFPPTSRTCGRPSRASLSGAHRLQSSPQARGVFPRGRNTVGPYPRGAAGRGPRSSPSSRA